METAMQDSFDHIPFVGRVDCLLALEKAWAKKQLFGIYGLRAVGKSRTVAEFLKQKGCKFHDQGHAGNQCENNPENVLHVLTIDMREIKAKEKLYAVLFSEISCLSAKIRDGNISDSDIKDEVISMLTETSVLTGPVIIFDNAEDTMEGQLKDDFLILCTTLVRKSESIKIFITSTTNALFAQLGPIFFMQEIAPMTIQESSTLMRNALADTDFGDYFDQITDMCCGLPLAILMVGSTMQDNINPRDVLASLSECRLKAFNFAGHRKKFDPDDDNVYKRFILRLTEMFQQRLAVLGYIPGSFTAGQAAKVLSDNESVAIAKFDTLVPIMQRNMIMYNSVTERLDIHGMVRECLKVYLEIKGLPEVRRRYVKTFVEEMKKLEERLNTRMYTKALERLSQEYPNFQKLLTEIEQTTEETYPFFVTVTVSCSSMIEKFFSVQSETFYECMLMKTQEYGQGKDEANVRLAYGSMFTNTKGDFPSGESNYKRALKVYQEDKTPSLELALVYQKLGWNLYLQWKGYEAHKCLEKSLELCAHLGQQASDISLSVLNVLGIVCTLIGNYAAGKKYHFEALNRRQEKFGGDHPSVGANFNNIGIYYDVLGDHENARFYFEMGLENKRKNKAPYGSLCASLTNTALQYGKLRQFDKAFELLDEIQRLYEKNMPNKASLGALYDNYGQLYMKQNHLAEALTKIKEGLQHREQAAPNGPSYAESLTNLSKVYILLEENESAIPPAKKVISIKDKLIERLPQVKYIYRAWKYLILAYTALGDKENLQVAYHEIDLELQRLIRVCEDQFNINRAQEFQYKLGSYRKRRQSIMVHHGDS
ncbi:hypothetical protein CHS0354_032301 [Potamilus streckersoni]|uniref:Uncharacterized protein n=1 Tax=Potamilus streckersoni TaxID=2493646 RepID=A0AAE0RQI1_9BIVA|nr:hypothetical protein CHS0354_032301 [Potamilus streckersoni]